jgi:hypothetical protein
VVVRQRDGCLLSLPGSRKARTLYGWVLLRRKRELRRESRLSLYIGVMCWQISRVKGVKGFVLGGIKDKVAVEEKGFEGCNGDRNDEREAATEQALYGAEKVQWAWF